MRLLRPHAYGLLLALAATSPAHAADETAATETAWITLPPSAGDRAWREGEHRGWSTLSEVSLNRDNERRLSGAATKGGDGESILMSRGDSDLYTSADFQDVEVKLEFLIPRGANSGVKLNGHYEIQIRDSHGVPVEKLTGDDCGGVYPRAELGPPYKYLDDGVPPRVNAAKPAGEWQTLEIAFHAPRFDAAGKKIENARFLRVVHNGEVIHENVELEHPTGAAWDEKAEIPRGPFQLQGDHGPVAFRNIQIRPLAR